MSRATSLVAVAQQLSQSVGVAVGALVVEIVLRLRGHETLAAADFPPAFIVVGLIAASSVFLFATMPPDAGEDMAHRKTAKQREPAPA
jgi:tellurite resistance protein TehA-like permease